MYVSLLKEEIAFNIKDLNRKININVLQSKMHLKKIVFNCIYSFYLKTEIGMFYRCKQKLYLKIIRHVLQKKNKMSKRIYIYDFFNS